MDKTSKVRKILSKWGSENDKRDFFWRREKLNFFQYLMVELLLQKTRAETAEHTIEIFVEKYRTPQGILTSDKGEVKKIIGTLGLQNQRLKAILEIAGSFRDGKPKSLEGIKGIGHYIRNSVACFYYNKRVPIIDVNTSRVISRIFGINNKVDLRKNKELIIKAEELLPKRNYKKFNWILLDFGALICKAKPLCKYCPASKYCFYFKDSYLEV